LEGPVIVHPIPFISLLSAHHFINFALVLNIETIIDTDSQHTLRSLPVWIRRPPPLNAAHYRCRPDRFRKTRRVRQSTQSRSRQTVAPGSRLPTNPPLPISLDGAFTMVWRRPDPLDFAGVDDAPRVRHVLSVLPTSLWANPPIPLDFDHRRLDGGSTKARQTRLPRCAPIRES